MPNHYRDIFDERGRAYDAAMRREPEARRQEFEHVLDLLAPRVGETLCDLPAGGGYVQHLLPAGVDLVSIETSRVFYELGERRAGQCGERFLCPLDATPLAEASVDAAMSVAGLHHLDDRVGTFREVFRILRPGGRSCFADVQAGSRVAGFLNGFVHSHCTAGHVGRFLDEGVRGELERVGFQIDVFEERKYAWVFSDAAAMVAYCRDLFGIDRASSAEIRDGIEQHLCVSEGADCRMSWELVFVRATKPPI